MGLWIYFHSMDYLWSNDISTTGTGDWTFTGKKIKSHKMNLQKWAYTKWTQNESHFYMWNISYKLFRKQLLYLQEDTDW